MKTRENPKWLGLLRVESAQDSEAEQIFREAYEAEAPARRPVGDSARLGDPKRPVRPVGVAQKSSQVSALFGVFGVRLSSEFHGFNGFNVLHTSSRGRESCIDEQATGGRLQDVVDAG